MDPEDGEAEGEPSLIQQEEDITADSMEENAMDGEEFVMECGHPPCLV